MSTDFSHRLCHLLTEFVLFGVLDFSKNWSKILTKLKKDALKNKSGKKNMI